MPDDLRHLNTAVAARLDALPRTDELAFISNGDPWSLARLNAAVDRLAAGMAAFGIRPGDRVALHLRNRPEMAVAYLACFRLGAVAAPLNLRFKQPELEDVLRRLQPRLYLGQQDLYGQVAGIDPAVLPREARFVVDAANAPMARPWAELQRTRNPALVEGATDEHAPAVLLMTSGTTGHPKFVAHSLATLAEGADRARHMGLGAGQRMAACLPMVHISGLWTFLIGLRRGMQLVLCDADPGAILETIEQYHCDVLDALPAMATTLIEEQRQRPRDVSSLRLAFSGGDAPTAGQQARWAETFSCELRSFWGSTEAIGSCTYGTSRGAVSRLNPNTGMRLVDGDGLDVAPGEPGEMLLRGTHVMLGYWQLSGQLSGLEDGWYRSGDLMRKKPDGDVEFVSRLKDLIVRGGSNISPIEVEAVIASHPAVAEVGVAGVPDPVLGQRVMAMVRLRDGTGAEVLSHITPAISGRLADYKLPERLFSIAALPRNATGKLDRARLTAMLQERLAAGAAEGRRPSVHDQEECAR
jgi:acyl-CoA synthetase (AMP-forming)/AMP-acid ligase II